MAARLTRDRMVIRLQYGVKSGLDHRATSTDENAWFTYTRSHP